MKAVINLAYGALLASLISCGEAEAPVEDAGWFADMSVPVQFQDLATRNSIARMEGYWPNTELVTQDNESVRFYDDLVKGRNVLINFMYTQCDGI